MKTNKEVSVLHKYNIVDQYANGFGWWSSREQQMEIIKRQEAWRLLGVAPGLSTYLGNYTITPNIGRKMDKKEIMQLCGLGKKAADFLHSLTDEDESRWLDNCEKSKRFATAMAESSFKRVEGTKGGLASGQRSR